MRLICNQRVGPARVDSRGAIWYHPRPWRPGSVPAAPTLIGCRFLEVCLQIIVRDNNVDQALKALKKKMQREGLFREMKLRNHYEKPSERRAREKAEAIRRARKLQRKKMQREGLLPRTK